MSDVVFYQLCRKFVDDERSIPAESQNVLYYTLSVGHHTDVIDCFSEKLRCTSEEYERVCALFEAGSDARYKMEGIGRSGEIMVDRTHAAMLGKAVRGILDQHGADGAAHDAERAWLEGFAECLAIMKRESGAYLIGRERNDGR